LITSAVAIPLLTHLIAGTTERGDQRAGLITIGWFITAALVLFLGVSIAAGLVLLRATRYTITDQRLLIESGLFSKSVDEIDMRLIDDTLFQQGFIHRLLGIGNVTVMSSDKNTPVFTLRGVRDPRQVRELIRTHSYQASQRQVFTRPT
ncbi:MAG: PH domain-containing protein, partial [Acidobacteria bacterium]|nr:PH domain-containing protein [Acidobacteriota bacterium]